MANHQNSIGDKTSSTDTGNTPVLTLKNSNVFGCWYTILNFSLHSEDDNFYLVFHAYFILCRFYFFFNMFHNKPESFGPPVCKYRKEWGGRYDLSQKPALMCIFDIFLTFLKLGMLLLLIYLDLNLINYY